MTTHYETLGVPQDASADDIQKAYRAKAAKHHPDAGGNIEEFKRISEAYECLNNEESRHKYDSFGGEYSLLEMAVMALADECFSQATYSDPVQMMRQKVDRDRGRLQDQIRSQKMALPIWEKKLVRFETANEKAKSVDGKLTIGRYLTHKIYTLKQEIAQLEGQVTFCTQVLAFIDGLVMPGGVSDMQRQWETKIGQSFVGFTANPRSASS